MITRLKQQFHHDDTPKIGIFQFQTCGGCMSDNFFLTQPECTIKICIKKKVWMMEKIYKGFFLNKYDNFTLALRKVNRFADLLCIQMASTLSSAADGPGQGSFSSHILLLPKTSALAIAFVLLNSGRLFLVMPTQLNA